MQRQKIIREKGAGIECIRCGEKTELRKHYALTARQLRQPFYYSQWYCCTNPNCATKQIMPNEYKIENNNHASKVLKRQQQNWEDAKMPKFDF